MVRNAHRTVLARVLAIYLLALAASPVTAPFSVIDSDDFGQSSPVDAHHPAHDMAEAHVKTAPHLVDSAPDLTPVLIADAGQPYTRFVAVLPLASPPPAFGVNLRL